MAAWVKQIARQVREHGAKAASWYCEWDEPDGTRRMKSCGAGTKGKRLAQAKADRINSQLTLGTYQSDRQNRTTWDAFVADFKKRTLTGLAAGSAREFIVSLAHFRRILNLAERPMSAITTERVDEFRAVRRTEAGKKPKSKVSPATVNKDLRHVKAALRVAVKWGDLDRMPDVEFEREPKKLPTYITPEDFARIYQACEAARFPAECSAGPAAWWRALLMFAQMTGWRIGEILALRWADVDLDAGRAITRAADNKGKRDEVTPLHPIVIEHLKPIRAFHPDVFAWEHHRRTLDVEFARIQDAAGIDLACPATGKRKDDEYAEGDEHECTGACHRYGFHDERRAFATMNAPNMTRETLQVLMRHKNPATTARYINEARQLNPAVAGLFVPPTKKVEAAG
jgi:integrase